MLDLYDKLRRYGESDVYPFHMPGHKRGGAVSMEDPYRLDITEIDGFDDLNHPEEFFREAMEEAARLYGTKATLFGVNGSSGALLAAIHGSVPRGGAVLLARNCHKAVYNAVLIRGLKPYYVLPEKLQLPARGNDGPVFWGSVSPLALEESLRSAEEKERRAGNSAGVRLVVVTSPSYEGVVSDIAALSEVAHRHGARLLVDEAHGAHLPFLREQQETARGNVCSAARKVTDQGNGAHGGYFPASAIAQGADLVVQSLHKTMPALTQTALLHVCAEEPDPEHFRECMRIYQTSSPSYVLSVSIMQAISWGWKNPEKMIEYERRIRAFREEAALWKHVRLYRGEGAFAYDPGKLVVYDESGSFTGAELHELLRTRFHLQPEMHGERHVLLMTSPADTEAGFARLLAALAEIDRRISEKESELAQEPRKKPEGREADEKQAMIETATGSSWMMDAEAVAIELLPEQAMLPATAAEAGTQTIPLANAAGRVSAEFVYVYPPEIPILVPGERITEELLTYINRLCRQGRKIRGTADVSGKRVRVCI
ncbi:MAG: aminotransferase class I/II-fold pyridoxal phosphate-dependent enzyme [Lachnospiraceae bacterium]|nr:aminotransferase class I/II-fold pyridoxal phosphate-dependent enzyme [Lachnospiraceae bacterium]